jgi:hypothetical protein
MSDTAFEEWAIVGIMGHQRIAGLVREVTIAGAGFIRVDVPEVEGEQAFSRIFGPGSIYSIDPVTEVTARAVAAGLKVSPVSRYDVSPLLQETARRVQRELKAGNDDEEEEPVTEICF